MRNDENVGIFIFSVVLLIAMFAWTFGAGITSGEGSGREQALEHICKNVCEKNKADFKIVDDVDCWCIRDIADEQPIGLPAPGISLYGMEEAKE